MEQYGSVGELLGYARVSTLEQDAALQHDALSAAGCWRTWTDTISGSTTERPELAKLMDGLRPGDTLVVWRLDRLGRSLAHLIETVRALADRGIGFRSLQESIDTTTPGGRLVFHIFGSLAEFERDLIRERTMAGLDAARRRGRVGGRPTVMTPAKTRQASRMLNAGTPLTEIAEVLGVSRTTLHRRLKVRNPTTSRPRPPAVAPEPEPAPPPQDEAARPDHGCPTCGIAPTIREDAAQQRADLEEVWLHPDPTTASHVATSRHCRHCQTRGPVVDVACGRCGAGPIVAGALVDDSTPGGLAYPVRRWLTAEGWILEPELVCPSRGCVA